MIPSEILNISIALANVGTEQFQWINNNIGSYQCYQPYYLINRFQDSSSLP